LNEAVENSEVIFHCLPTPPSNDGSADVSSIFSVTDRIADLANGQKILVTKSTVPVGTTQKIQQIVQKSRYPIEVASNPEFLKEGSAVQDSMKPDRIIIGSKNPSVIKVLRELYEPFVRTGNPILVMDEASAEMTKYAANAFLATKISFMNELANLCERIGVDIDLVRTGIGTDPRIGKQFIFPGVGYGGSCFPKDVKALIHIGEQNGQPMSILRAVDAVNQEQKNVILQKIARHFQNDLRNKTIALWGLSFKPQTDDIREAPALTIINGLLNMGAIVHAHDPIANEAVRSIYTDQIKLFDNNYDALQGVEALVIITEWNEFRRPDFAEMRKRMKHAAIFDGRNIYDPEEIRQLGFVYYGIGR
jgi:UDPglucose 6-dehydrogenase